LGILVWGEKKVKASQELDAGGDAMPVGAPVPFTKTNILMSRSSNWPSQCPPVSINCSFCPTSMET
jgi:hypothetical protein